MSVFLDLHRKNRQLERMPTRERTHCAELGGRLAALEQSLTGDGPPDLVELRALVRESRRLVTGDRMFGPCPRPSS